MSDTTSLMKARNAGLTLKEEKEPGLNNRAPGFQRTQHYPSGSALAPNYDSRQNGGITRRGS
jgi:hypothetical protein